MGTNKDEWLESAHAVPTSYRPVTTIIILFHPLQGNVTNVGVYDVIVSR